MTQNNEAKVLTPEQIENNKQQIIDIYRNCVKREGSDKLSGITLYPAEKQPR